MKKYGIAFAAIAAVLLFLFAGSSFAQYGGTGGSAGSGGSVGGGTGSGGTEGQNYGYDKCS